MSEALCVCVFCSSSEAVSPRLRSLAVELGDGIAARGWRLVYGGGDVGLMGEVARAALAGGAHVTGVIPHRLAGKEIALDKVTELIRVDTMRERKRLMDERADAFVILPGGIGTLEELLEVLTLKQLGYHDRSITLLDAGGFWAPLRRQIDDIIGAGLGAPGIRDLLSVSTDVAGTLDAVSAEWGQMGPLTDAALIEAAVDDEGAVGPSDPQG